MKNEELLWLDVTSKEALRVSLEFLVKKWILQSELKNSLPEYLADNLWPYLSEDFGTPGSTHSFEMP